MTTKINLVDTLTESERRVYDLLFTGATDNEIGDTLSISRATVRFHLRHVYDKLGVDNRAGAVAYLNNQGLVTGVGTGKKGEEGLFSVDELREAAAKLVALGIADRKEANSLVTDLILALEERL